MEVSNNSISTKSLLEALSSTTKSTTTNSRATENVFSKESPKDFSVKNLLDSLFKDLALDLKSKDVVLQTLKNSTISSSAKDTAAELRSIIDSLKSSNISAKSLDKLLLNISKLDGETLQTQIKDSGVFLESKLANLNSTKSTLPISLTQTLDGLKTLLGEQEGLGVKSELVDKILNAKVVDKNFMSDMKKLLNALESSSKNADVQTVAKLDTLLQKTLVLNSKIDNLVEVFDSELKNIVQNIAENLDDIESNSPKIQELIGGLKSTLGISQNSKTEFLSVGEKLQQVVNVLKSELSVKVSNIDSHIEMSKLTQGLKDSLDLAIKDKKLVLNQPLQTSLNPKDEIVKDVKANLLQLKDELSKSGDLTAKDVLPKIDKVLTNINYYQLTSYSMGANVLYLPLLWEGLDEGQVSIKKLKKNRFFCEINLKLKEFGKIDLLVMLFDNVSVNISIFTQSDEFLSRIRDNLQFLRQGISSVGLVPSNIYLYDSLRDDGVKRETKRYVQNQQIGSGISLHV
jgi:hypothetical protein